MCHYHLPVSKARVRRTYTPNFAENLVAALSKIICAVFAQNLRVSHRKLRVSTVRQRNKLLYVPHLAEAARAGTLKLGHGRLGEAGGGLGLQHHGVGGGAQRRRVVAPTHSQPLKPAPFPLD
jgi:hypothetical protein